MSKWLTYWRISSTSAGLARGNFFARGLPPPQTPIFKDYSELVPQSQGGLAKQGYSRADILWSELDYEQGRTLRRIVDAAIAAGGTIYASVDRADGSKLANDFIDISGIVHPLILEPASRSQGLVYQNVTLTINAVQIDADPSTVI